MDDVLPTNTVVNNTNKSKNAGTLKASSSTPSFDYLASANQTNDLLTSRAISTDNFEPPPCSQELLEKSGEDCNNNNNISPVNRLNLGRSRREEEDSESFFGLGPVSNRPPPIKMVNPKLASLTNYHNSHLQRMDNDSSSIAEDRGSRLNLNNLISPISASGIGGTGILRNSNPFNSGSNSPLMNPLCRPTIPPIRSLNSGNLPPPSPHNPGSNSSKGTNENGSDRYGKQNSGWILVPVSTTDNNNSSPLTSSTNLRSYTGCVLRNSNNSMSHSNSNRSSANRNNTNGGDDNSGDDNDPECGSGGVRSRPVRISGVDDRGDSIGGNDNGNGNGNGNCNGNGNDDGDGDGDDGSDEEDALEMMHHGYSPRPGMKNRLSKPRANVWTSSAAGVERGGGQAREREVNEGERQMNLEKVGSVSIGNMSVQSFKFAGDEDEDEDEDDNKADGMTGWGGKLKKEGGVQVQWNKGQSEEVEGRDKYPSNALSSGSLQDPNSSMLMKFSSAYSCASLETIESAANPNSGDSRLIAEDEAMRLGRRMGGSAGGRGEEVNDAGSRF
eukprot:CAMPEP_0175039858 /NCGR_PEP_ID=MMETSP0052_2-20121109/880_1 /TAXON_ID=51329 ORGANISM="Polytomella parva, Strain SAG 63-3" /NCGR_SAMPLE_ID=MMETSP0052_2 /ASSEMBLY_ACC=CAM_ASM_000194 /LENGTH=555 /DNA_ID=CAMNT_0016301883 /DNA_START=515 /DNA_END=2182 /DNA_ORIENTATION=-